jgi:hypothetical protein
MQFAIYAVLALFWGKVAAMDFVRLHPCAL